MRKLIYPFNLTLDGCSEHNKQFVDAEMMNYYTDKLESADLFVYGRKTYELMVPYWPDVLKDPSASETDADFAKVFVSMKKVVFSRTLENAEEGNVRITRADLREEILRLKQEEGKDILVGGVDLPSQLLKLGLIDEFRFVIGPIIAGGGRRLFDSVRLPEGLRLKLMDRTELKSGCVALHYSRE